MTTLTPGSTGETSPAEGSGMPRPVLLRDVDGVLNALSSSPDLSIWKDWQHARVRNRIGEWSVLWSPSVIRRVLGWVEQDLVDVHWLTTWMGDANEELAAVLGLPRLPVLGSGFSTDPALSSGGSVFGWWKADVVDEFLADRLGTPFVWVDDDLRVMGKLQARLRAVHDCLLIAPHSNTGLIPRHLDTIQAWLHRHPVPSAVTHSAQERI